MTGSHPRPSPLALALVLVVTRGAFAQQVPVGPSPSPSPSPSPAGPEITWRDGATTVVFPGRAQLRLSSRVQSRLTHEQPGESVQLPGTEERGDGRDSFRIRRAKTKLEGWFHEPWLMFELQLNWPGVASAGNPGAMLEDAAVNWDVTTGDKAFMVKFGQYKVPFGRQELTSSGAQQLVDRAQVSNAFSHGRDVGLQVWGVALDGRVEWRAGVFNGGGPTRSANDNDAFQYVARVLVQPRGRVPLGVGLGTSGPHFSESDFESKGAPIWALALGYEHNDRHHATAGNDPKDVTWGLDGVLKWRGLFATAEAYWRERRPETGEPSEVRGWFAQAGRLLGRGRRWEVAARYGRLDPSSLRGDDAQTELRGGASYYHVRHALKVQADVGRLRDAATDTSAAELRVQAQFQF